jgi:hypothetical protein
MTQLLDDGRHRPVVFETRAEQRTRRLRRPIRLLAGSTLVFAALTGAVGLALGGSAVWSVVETKVPNNAPAPLWITPPTHVAKGATEDRATHDRLAHDVITTSEPEHPATSGHSSSTQGTHGATPTTRGEAEPGNANRGGGTSTTGSSTTTTDSSGHTSSGSGKGSSGGGKSSSDG